MAKNIILITGGQRSGKSELAERLALEASPNPIYLATAQVLDEEFRERVNIHQRRRGPQWTTIEEPAELSRHNFSGRSVLVDCVTMWATNVFFGNGEDVEKSLEILKSEFEKFTAPDGEYIFVSNEIGSGVVGADPLTRKFTDLQGWLNQFIASQADEFYLTVTGIPLKIK
ncbi:MAG: bifunctional adenosylcobinamide kinase/adenosylcobinamide-phosphate guanylyltransferase [Muribaculaceae bacterium]|nr:bifunctional adenosylcobinamide kinase/adenosylcobinamide-phosphate guanylyltransferase [Muribaculaceae bacterium]